MVPQVQSAEDVERAVSACLYPPRGTREFRPRHPSDYERIYEEVVQTENDHIVVIAQIEIVNAVNDFERIVAVPDLAAIIIGPGDLSVALGTALIRSIRQCSRRLIASSLRRLLRTCLSEWREHLIRKLPLVGFGKDFS